MKSDQHQLSLPFSHGVPEGGSLSAPLANHEVAGRLEEAASLLEAQGSNPFRVRAYRTAARRVRELDEPLSQLLDREDLAGLERLEGIGPSLARTIDQLVRTGRSPRLERLRGASSPEKLFATVADVGPELARQIHQVLGIDTLAELWAAANDGRLAEVPGMGPKRVRAVRESLAGRFRKQPAPQGNRPSTATRRTEPSEKPPVAELLDVDRQYRLLADLGRLPRIAPRRFNPTQEAWLPVLRTRCGPRHYTALYSNTARAHELGTTRDWVVIYRDPSDGGGQWTVITGQYGRLRNRRIVRGREAECAAYYQRRAAEKAGTAGSEPSQVERAQRQGDPAAVPPTTAPPEPALARDPTPQES